MRILYLTPFHSPEIGGAESFADELEKEVIKWHQVTVLTFQPLQMQKKQSGYCKLSNHLEIYRMNWLAKQSNVWSGVSFQNALSVIPQMVIQSILLCLKKRFDIIHAHGLLSGFVAVLLKKIFRKKTFITLLAIYEFQYKPKWFKRIASFILKNTDTIFVEGEAGEKDLRGLGFGLNVKIFYHWVDQELFKPPESRSTNKINILFVGRPIYKKGRHIIEQAEHILKHQGNYNYKFIYAENVTQQELAKLYQMAHICVVPSLYAEGYSRVVAESASCGCAVITSNRGSLKEMVRYFGYAIEPSPETFAAIIETYKEHENKLAYDFSIENFSSKNAEIFLNEYN